jgi:FkbM family methyltransferase
LDREKKLPQPIEAEIKKITINKTKVKQKPLKIFPRMIRSMLKPLEKKRKYQHFWKRLHAISLSGMNIGSGENCARSGEKYAMKFVASGLSSNQEIIIFDVGANIGQYTLELVKVFDMNKTKIFCFEPSPAAFQQLVASIRETANVFLFNTGLGEKDEKRMLYTDFKGSDLGSLYDLKTPFRPFANRNAEMVEIISLENFCRENHIRRIDFLKMDIEGHELKVLEGALNMIKSRNIKYIQFEFGPCNIDSRTYFRDYFFLLNEYYKIYRIVQDGIFPIDSYSHTSEVFLTTNYLAEIR